MTTTTQKTTDLPLTDPRNPLHRAPAQTEKLQDAKPVAVEVKSDKPQPMSKKAKRQAKAEARKAAKQPQTTEQAAAKLAALLPAQPAPVAETAPHAVPEVERVKTPRSVVPGKYKSAYAAHDNTCGDDIGVTLKEFTFRQDGEGRDSIDLELLAQVAADNAVDMSKYAGLNNGMKRMNLSNKLRGMHRHGKNVKIGQKVIKGIAPKVEKAEAKTA